MSRKRGRGRTRVRIHQRTAFPSGVRGVPLPALAAGTVAGLAIVYAFRMQNAFTDPPQWVYAFAACVGAIVAIAGRWLTLRARHR